MSETTGADDLLVEDRAGVPHFVTGQHRAYLLGDNDPPTGALLRFADVMGWGWLVLCERDQVAGRWTACYVSQFTATGLGTNEWTKVIGDFEFSDKMLAALDNAEPVDGPSSDERGA